MPGGSFVRSVGKAVLSKIKWLHPTNECSLRLYEVGEALCPPHRTRARKSHFSRVAQFMSPRPQYPGRKPRALHLPVLLRGRVARRRPGGWCLSHRSWEGRVQRAGPRTAATRNSGYTNKNPLLQKRFLKLHEYLVTWGQDLLHFAQDKDKIQPSATFPHE